jgi:hypothetical protein
MRFLEWFTRSRKNTLRGPFLLRPISDGSIAQVKLSSPFNERLRLAIIGETHIASGVAKVDCSCNPCAISRLIALAIVKPFQRVIFRWSFANVFKERLETFVPFLANLYSSTAVVLPCGIASIIATQPHRAPCKVFGCSTQSMCSACSKYLLVKATAALSMMVARIAKVACLDDNNLTTFAFAFPVAAFTIMCRQILTCREITEVLSGKIVETVSSFLASLLGKAKFCLLSFFHTFNWATLPAASNSAEAFSFRGYASGLELQA